MIKLNHYLKISKLLGRNHLVLPCLKRRLIRELNNYLRTNKKKIMLLMILKANLIELSHNFKLTKYQSFLSNLHLGLVTYG